MMNSLGEIMDGMGIKREPRSSPISEAMKTVAGGGPFAGNPDYKNKYITYEEAEEKGWVIWTDNDIIDIPKPDDSDIRQYRAMNDRTDTITDCPVCKGKTVNYTLRFWLDKWYWSIVRKACPCRNTLMLRENGAEEAAKRCTFDTYRAKESWQVKIKERATRYARDKEGWFYIRGQSGSGKTHICLAIMNKFIEDGYQVQYMQWVPAMQRLREAMSDDEYTRILNRYRAAELLVIDDFLKVRITDSGPSVSDISKFEVNTAYTILNDRYNRRLPTVISSELFQNELAEADGALAGRIREMCGEGLIMINRDPGKDQRRKAAE